VAGGCIKLPLRIRNRFTYPCNQFGERGACVTQLVGNVGFLKIRLTKKP
jgi:hypothetical protein